MVLLFMFQTEGKLYFFKFLSHLFLSLLFFFVKQNLGFTLEKYIKNAHDITFVISFYLMYSLNHFL